MVSQNASSVLSFTPIWPKYIWPVKTCNALWIINPHLRSAEAWNRALVGSAVDKKVGQVCSRVESASLLIFCHPFYLPCPAGLAQGNKKSKVQLSCSLGPEPFDLVVVEHQSLKLCLSDWYGNIHPVLQTPDCPWIWNISAWVLHAEPLQLHNFASDKHLPFWILPSLLSYICTPVKDFQMFLLISHV